MSDVLKNLQLTTWYKALMAVSAPAFLVVLATQRNALTMIFFGVFLIGLGEWKNYPKREIQFRPIGAGHIAKVSDVPRNANGSESCSRQSVLY